MSNVLTEIQTFDSANIKLENVEDPITKAKKLCMAGIFLQSEVRNLNKRIYPFEEIRRAVDALNERIKTHGPVPGESEHPENLNLNLDRISHTITEMRMEGNNAMGKLTILPTPCGNTIRALLENNVKLGVSSRGNGSVDSSGRVYGYEIFTVDIVGNPSGPNCYPTTIYEKLMNGTSRTTKEVLKLSEEINHDPTAQKYFKKEVLTWFDGLKW